jgi:hypothetical protein
MVLYRSEINQEPMLADEAHGPLSVGDLFEANRVQEQMVVDSVQYVLSTKSYVTISELKKMFEFAVADFSVQLSIWKNERRIFSFEHDGCEYFPIYGFDHNAGCRPHALISKVLEIFGAEKSGWGIAFGLRELMDF